MKKKTKIILLILVATLVFPVYTGTLKDGGTKTFASLTYKVVCWNRLTEDGIHSSVKVYPFPYNFRSVGDLWYFEEKNL